MSPVTPCSSVTGLCPTDLKLGAFIPVLYSLHVDVTCMCEWMSLSPHTANSMSAFETIPDHHSKHVRVKHFDHTLTV